MAEIVIRECFKELINMKKVVCASVIISTLACTGLGYYRFQTAHKNFSETKIVQYKEALVNYDASFKEISINIKALEDQVQRDQNYLEKAAYLKLNPQDIKVAECCYIINAPTNSSEKLKGFVGLYDSAVNCGQAIENLQREKPEFIGNYIQDNIIGKSYGNNYTVRVLANDFATANIILTSIEKTMANIQESVTIPHELVFVKRKNFTIADSNVQRLQSKKINTVIRNRDKLAEYRSKFADYQNKKAYYERAQKPLMFVSNSLPKTLLKYFVFGVFLGLLWPTMWIFYKRLVK